MNAALAALLLLVAAPGSPPPALAPAPRADLVVAQDRAAPAPDARALAGKVQAFYEQTKDLRARFRQTYTYAGFGRRQVSGGALLVKKPGMMRWDYETPAPKTVAVKGSRLVQYEPQENQAYVDEHFDASALSAAVTFLLGKGDLAKEFELGVDGSGGLVLTPKVEDPRVRRITLQVGDAGEVRATRVEDGAGNVNELRFDEVKRNAGIPDAAFDVKLPADVQRMTAPGK
jgi:outer membrane lipoprotein carrier protein